MQKVVVGEQVWESDKRIEGSPAERWHRRLVVALASFWIIDGLLQFQPSMYSRGLNGFLANVLQYNTMGRPNLLTDLIRWSVTFTYGTASHQIVFNTLAAIIQIAIGVAILAKRTERSALVASAVWAVVPWVVGEAMGQMLFPQASMAFTGTPGAALIYLFLSVILIRDHGSGASEKRETVAEETASEAQGWKRFGSVADLGIAGSTLALAMWAVVWIGSAIFELEFSNWAPGSISAQLSAASGGEPGFIASMDRFLGHLLVGRGTVVALLMAVVQAWVGAAALRPELRRIALGLGIAVSLIYWIAGQNFGELFTGNASDPNLGPAMVIFALTLWPLASRHPVPEIIDETT